MKRFSVVFLTITALFVLSVSGSAFGWDPRQEQSLIDNSKATIAAFKEKDPTLQVFFDEAAGYAVYPTVGKGAIVVGAAHGSGLVFENDEIIGKSKINQVTVGLALGGQAYSEIVFFETADDLANLKKGDLEFAAQASAIAVDARAAADADYNTGVAVFTMGKGGLMFEASIGGQHLSFEAADKAADKDGE
jgi:hypothetical protein